MKRFILSGVLALALVTGGVALASQDHISSGPCNIGDHTHNVLFEKKGCYKSPSPSPSSTSDPSTSPTVSPSPTVVPTTTPSPSVAPKASKAPTVLPDTGGSAR